MMSMNIIMKNLILQSITEVEQFLAGNQNVAFELNSRQERYELVRDHLVRLRYKTLSKKDKGKVKQFLRLVAGYSARQLKRLIRQWKKGSLNYQKRKAVGAAIRTYQAADIALLIKTDILHKTPHGRATQEILRREYFTFGQEKYETIAKISVSHIYNLRKTNQQYLSSEALTYTKTPNTPVNIGERRKPQPEGKPGYLRVDSVHQGDKEGEKGVYHINIVDEVTQWEIVGCVEKISDLYLGPLLEKLLDQFPFIVINFHSDNGSEYLNKTVAQILNRLLITQTKSRARRTNDQALVEGKNGSVIRKHMGRNYIAQSNAPLIEEFYEKYFNIYLNFHRICGFATIKTDRKGKERKVYDVYRTPYEALKSHLNASDFLKPSISFEILDKIAYTMSDNEFAEEMKKAKTDLVKKLKN